MSENNKRFNNNSRKGRWNNKKKSSNRNGKSTGGTHKRGTTREVKFAPYSNNEKGGYAVYDTVLKAVISKVSAETDRYTEDIVESLEDESYLDLEGMRPTRDIAQNYMTFWGTDEDGWVVNSNGEYVLDDVKLKILETGSYYKAMYAEAEASKVALQKEFDHIHGEKIKAWLNRIQSFTTNKRKAYDIIRKFCTASMIERLESDADYSVFKGDPLLTLRKIKVVIHDPIKSRYEYASLTEAFVRLFTMRQQDGESLSAYSKRFKAAADIVESHMGANMLNEFVTRTMEYKLASATQQVEIRNDAFERWMAYLFLSRSDKSKYGGYIKHQDINQSNCSITGTKSTYPGTLQGAYDALSNYNWDRSPKKGKTPKGGGNNSKHTEDEKGIREDDDRKPEASFATQGTDRFKKKCLDNGLCFVCGDQHKFDACGLKDKIAKVQWYINSGRRHQTNTNHQHLQHHQTEVPDDYTIPSQAPSQVPSQVPSHHSTYHAGGYGYPTIAQIPPAPSSQGYVHQQHGSTQGSAPPPPWESKRRPFIGCHIETDLLPPPPPEVVAQLSKEKDRDCIYRWTKEKHGYDLIKRMMIDSGSTVDLINRSAFKGKIRKSCRPIGIDSSNGHSDHDEEMTVKGWSDRAYISDTTPANIFALCNLIKKFHVSFDTRTDGCFHLYDKKTSTHLCKVCQDERGLWTTPIPDSLSNSELVQYLETMSENAVGFTPKQVADAKRARALYHNMNCPDITTFKKILQFGGIKNCPVTVQDAVLAERIFGPDVPSIKGRATRRKESRVKNDLIEIPPEFYCDNKLTLCIDTMFINGVAFLVGIDTKIRYRTAVHIKDRTKSSYFEAIDMTFREYNSGGWVITIILCDKEFECLYNEIKDDLGITINPSNSQAHQPEAERNIRTCKEQLRIRYQKLPYPAIPKIMIIFMICNRVASLNRFPVKGGLSSYYSPRQFIHRRALDYKKELQFQFGQYVIPIHDDTRTKNTLLSRGGDGIYLMPTNTMQGGHNVMDLVTGEVQNRGRIIQAPITQAVIDRVASMATHDGVKSLRFEGRHGHQLEQEFYSVGPTGVVVDPYTHTITDGTHEIGVGTHETGVGEEDDDFEDESESEDDDTDEDLDLGAGVPVPETEEDGPNIVEDDTEVPNHGVPNDQEDRSVQGIDVIPGVPAPIGPTPVTPEPPTPDLDPGPPTGPTHRYPTRSRGTVGYSTHTLKEQAHNLIHQTQPKLEYELEDAQLICMYVGTLQRYAYADETDICMGTQYLLHKGLKIFKKKGEAGALKEIKQLHDRTCFEPILPKDLTQEEKRKAQEALTYLTEKRTGEIKGRTVFNGKPTREWLSREESASPTVTQDSIVLTAMIDCHEGRDVVMVDAPNAFIQAYVNRKEGYEKIVMKIRGVLIDMLVDLAPHVYEGYVVYEGGKRVLYVEVIRAIYGMLMSALLWYKKFRAELEDFGFEFNPYDACVANRMVNGSQQTIRFHVDDLMASHVDPEANNELHRWIEYMYGDLGPVKCHRGNEHDYLGVIYRFNRGYLEIDMVYYVENMIKDFPIKFDPQIKCTTAAKGDLFDKRVKGKLPPEQAETFHKFVAKALFVCKRGRLDIQPVVAVLCTRVKEPTTHEWNGLLHLMKYLTATVKMTRRIDTRLPLSTVNWWIDASFAVHPDFKSHTGGAATGENKEGGAITGISRKQKLNTRSSTEAELVAVDDCMTSVLWTALFMEAQGYRIERNIIRQDNRSAILLETNGRSSAGQRSRAINIRYFFVTDQVARGNAVIQYCPTDLMMGDFMTKPLQGTKFTDWRDSIMNAGFNPDTIRLQGPDGDLDPVEPHYRGLAQMVLDQSPFHLFTRP